MIYLFFFFFSGIVPRANLEGRRAITAAHILHPAGQQLGFAECGSHSSAGCSPWELCPVEILVLSFSSSIPTCSSLLLLHLYPLWASFPAVESPLPTFGVLCPLFFEGGLAVGMCWKPGSLLHVGLERSVGSFRPCEVELLCKDPEVGSSHLPFT